MKWLFNISVSRGGRSCIKDDKGALRCFFVIGRGKSFLFALCLHKLNKVMTEKKKKHKLTIKDNTTSYCSTLFTCGGPCHLSSFKQCSIPYVFLWEQLLYCYLINIVIIKILSLSFFSKTTQRPFLSNLKVISPPLSVTRTVYSCLSENAKNGIYLLLPGEPVASALEWSRQVRTVGNCWEMTQCWIWSFQYICWQRSLENRE